MGKIRLTFKTAIYLTVMVFAGMIIAMGGLALIQINRIIKPFSTSLPHAVSAFNKSSYQNDLSRLILYYDEVLTQAARNYAYTKEVKWKQRYLAAEPELDRCIGSAIETGGTEDKLLFGSVDSANQALVIMEHSSIAFVDSGHVEKAVALLESAEYWRQKGIYKRGLEQYSAKRGNQVKEALGVSDKALRDALNSGAKSVMSGGRWLILVMVFALIAVCLMGVMGLRFARSADVLRESEARFKAIFEGSNDALMLLTEKGFFDCNLATLEMFGFATVEEFSRVHPADISPLAQPDGTESFPAAMERITTAFETGSNRFEWVHRRASGEDFPAEVLLTAFDMNGKRVLQATVRDITKRKHAELALLESEQKYRALIETTDTGFLILDNQGCVLDANREYVRLSGHDELSEILGRCVIEWTAEDSRQKNAEAVARCVKDGMIRNLIIEYVNKSGGTIPVEINATVNGDGEKMRIISLCRDITERRKAEQALAESEKSFRSMFDVTPEGVVLISPNTNRFVAVNPAMRTLLGYSEEEFMGLSPEEITPPEAKEIMRCSIAQLEEGRSTADHEGITLKKDGSKVNVIVGNRLLQWHGENVYYTTFKDITKRKRAEIALAESEKNFRVMFEASTDALNLVGIEDGRFLEVNNAMCLMFGYSHDELLCMSPRDLIDKENIPQQNEVRTEVLKQGSVTSDEGTVVRKRDGTMLQVLISAQIVAWKGKRVIHSSLRDITPLKQIQDQLRKKNGEILEFTDMVTHDLKKPLTTMNIVLGLAKKNAFGPLNPDGVDAIDTGIEASHYMQEMLEDLLACARLESGTQELIIGETRFRELADEVLGRLKFQIEEKKIQIVPPDKDISVMADRKQITRVLMNLVGNAINYIGSGPDKFIRIGWEQKNGMPVFMVADNGIGIPEGSRKDLFGKFKRGSNVAGVQGTGLGLSIVKGIVEAHGGKIWFESDVNKGTTFYFTLAGKEAIS
jgi:PAS domain S-box-containing protein